MDHPEPQYTFIHLYSRMCVKCSSRDFISTILHKVSPSGQLGQVSESRQLSLGTRYWSSESLSTAARIIRGDTRIELLANGKTAATAPSSCMTTWFHACLGPR
jgi:hypothetical protein